MRYIGIRSSSSNTSSRNVDDQLFLQIIFSRVTVCKDKLKKVRVWSRNFENASKFVQETSQSFPNIEFKAVGTAKEAVEGADIINTVSFSPTPILEVLCDHCTP